MSRNLIPLRSSFTRVQAGTAGAIWLVSGESEHRCAIGPCGSRYNHPKWPKAGTASQAPRLPSASAISAS